MATSKPGSFLSKKTKKPKPRVSSSLLRLDMRLPGRVKAELKTGPGGLKGGRAVKEFIEKGNIRPVLVQTTRHETLRRYFEELDKDQSGTLEFHEMRRWLPKIGLDNAEFRESVTNHFKFMDKDGSEEVDFREFALATIDAAEQSLGCYEDEQYAAAFGMEIYMFLALCARTKALRSFQRDQDATYEEGNGLLPFFQFGRLLTASQSCFMPYELFQPEDASKEWRSTAGSPPQSPQALALRALSRGFPGAQSNSEVEGGTGTPASPASPSSPTFPREQQQQQQQQQQRVNDDTRGGGDHNGFAGATSSPLASPNANRRTSFENEDGGGGGGGGSKMLRSSLLESSSPPRPLSPPPENAPLTLRMGYEDLWGLEGVAEAPHADQRVGNGGSLLLGEGCQLGSTGNGDEDASVRRDLLENRRKWAAKKRALVVSKAKAQAAPSTSPGRCGSTSSPAVQKAAAQAAESWRSGGGIRERHRGGSGEEGERRAQLDRDYAELAFRGKQGAAGLLGGGGGSSSGGGGRRNFGSTPQNGEAGHRGRQNGKPPPLAADRALPLPSSPQLRRSNPSEIALKTKGGSGGGGLATTTLPLILPAPSITRSQKGRR